MPSSSNLCQMSGAASAALISRLSRSMTGRGVFAGAAMPFHAVTSANGRFELKGVPPGTYTVEAWHEKLGTQTQTVTIGEKQTSDLSFTFKG